jgi:hypothetical protein
VSARSRMTHRTTIERYAPGSTDDWGNPSPGSWSTLTAGVACWFWSDAEREAVGPTDTRVVEDARAIMPRGTDVREADRLNGVTERDGTLVRAGLLQIESVVNRRDHLEVLLRGIAAA